MKCNAVVLTAVNPRVVEAKALCKLSASTSDRIITRLAACTTSQQFELVFPMTKHLARAELSIYELSSGDPT
jgi:hypothetical protein